MNRNLKNLAVFLLVVIAFALLLSCSTKKKNLDISKEQLEQASSVKIEQKGSVTDSSKIEIKEQEESWTKVVEEWFEPVDKSQPVHRKTTYTKGNKQKETSIQNAIRAGQSAVKDSTGTVKKESKIKQSRKVVEESKIAYITFGIVLIVLGVVALLFSHLRKKNVDQVEDWLGI